MRKGHKPENEKNRVPLVPTRAALFGLDVRFRAVDERINAKKVSRLPAFNADEDPNSTGKRGGQNRHLYPPEKLIEDRRHTERKREVFNPGTCYDTVITAKLNTRLPETVSYLNYRDLQPKKVLNEEQREVKHQKFLKSLDKSSNEIAYLEQSR